MALTNAAYDRIMRDFEEKRRESEQRFYAKKEALEEMYPELKAYSERLHENAAQRARAAILNEAGKIESLTTEKQNILRERAEFFRQNGIPESDFKPEYHCPKCEDRGLVNGEKCDCFKAAEIRYLYEESGLGMFLNEQNFDALTMDYYSKEAEKNSKSEYDFMLEIIGRCRKYAENFDKNGGSLLFYGPTGVGKSFLSNCIAKELLDSGHSVVYYSSVSLFERLSRLLDAHDAEQNDRMSEDLMESDLLIIDDLGTEFLNSYTNAKFFQIINERVLRKKSTIISTNLSPDALRDRYSERVASRILSDYEPIRIRINDIRIKKRFQK